MNSVIGSSRRWLFVALTVVIAIGLLLALLHAPFGRSSVLRYASSILAERYGVQLRAERLDYNLLTLDFELTDVSLATAEETPFFGAGRVHVDLPWSAVTGPLALSTLEVDHAMLSLIQSADGSWNLPTSNGDEASESDTPVAFPAVERFHLTGLGINVQSPEYDLAASEISLQVDAASQASRVLVGPLHVAQPIALRWRDQRTTIDQLDAQVAFDEESLALEPLELDLPEGHLVVEGRVLSPFGEPTLDFTYRGDVVLGLAAAWWRPDHGVEGQAVASGTITGPISAPRVTAEIETAGLRWAEVSDLAVRATARLEPTAFIIDNVSVTHGDANLEASAQLALVDPPEPSRVEATWHDLDTLALVRELELELPYTPAGIVSGHGAVTWTEFNPRDIQFETEITSRAQEDQSGVVPFGGVARINVQGGRWRAELDEMSVPGLSVNGRVDGQLPPSDAPVSEATLQGGVVVTASDLAQMAQTFGLTGLAGDDAVPGITGAATAEITLTGAVGSPIADGQIFDARIGYQGIEGIDLRSVFSAGESGISLDQLTAAFGPNLIDGTLRLDLDASTVDGVLDIRLSDLSALAPVVPAAVAPTGRLDARATVSGSLDAPHLEAEVEGHDLTVGGRPLDQLSASASLDDGVLRIETLEVRQHEGRAQLSGSYTLADGTYELDVTGRELALESLAATTPDDSSLSGQLQFGIASAGSLSDPSAMGTVRIDALEWSGRSLGVADLALEIDGGILRLDAGIPSLSATAQAEVGLIGDTTFNVTADFLRTELERLLAPTTGATPAPDVSGIASLHLTASSPW